LQDTQPVILYEQVRRTRTYARPRPRRDTSGGSPLVSVAVVLVGLENLAHRHPARPSLSLYNQARRRHAAHTDTRTHICARARARAATPLVVSRSLLSSCGGTRHALLTRLRSPPRAVPLSTMQLLALILASLALASAAPAQRKLQLNSFNCFTRERWSDEKVEWCCAAKSLGCDGRQEPVINVKGGKR